jgi:fucose 4-O-acetylase-like acetyltransferase
MNSINTEQNTQRIEYFDTIKGFLILSVVLCHVSGYCLGIQDDIPSLHPILFEFRNPPFFFISGFFAYKIGVIWNIQYTLSVIKKKFISIAWPTTVFLFAIIYIHPSFHGRSLLQNGLKSLWFYWFTYSLFIFFLFQVVLDFTLNKLRCNDKTRSLLYLFFGFISYMIFSVQSVYSSLPISNEIKNLCGTNYWGFYFFFALGLLAKKHQELFAKITTNSISVGGSIIIFITFNILSEPMQYNHFNIFRLGTYLSSLIILISFFRSYTLYKPINVLLCYIGKKTLDIYLIHYFFLPLAIYEKVYFLRESPMPIIEFMISLSIAFLVIAFSLLTSRIIRLSPHTALLFFGDLNSFKTNNLNR